jgi:hypothetical protein
MLTVAPDRLRRRAGSRRSRRRRSRSGRGSRSPSSIRSRLMCVRMADSSMRSAVAISRFQSPRATSSRTCRSGGVSASRPADRRGRGRLLGHAVDHAADDRGREQGVAGGPRVDARDQLLGSGSLDQEARGPTARSAPKTSSCSRLSGSAPAPGARRAPARASRRSRRRPACGRPSARPGASSRARSTAPDRLMPHRRSRSPSRRRGAPRTPPT